MSSALSAPFYIALVEDESLWTLGGFIVASGVASLLSGAIWGRFADSSSKYVMITAGLMTSAIGLGTATLGYLHPEILNTQWYLPTAFFILSIAHSGVRIGRSTYVVNLATGNKRTDYVSISNSVIGVLLLLVGLIGTLTPLMGINGVIGILSLMALIGALLGTRMPQVE